MVSSCIILTLEGGFAQEPGKKNTVNRGDAVLVGRQKTMAWTLKKEYSNE